VSARNPLGLIGELAGRDVLVTLHLSSGRDVRGTLIDVAHDRGGSVALIGNVRVNTDVTHVSLNGLEAVTVHDAHTVGAPPVPDPTPGKLELRRLLLASSNRLMAAGFKAPLDTTVGEDPRQVASPRPCPPSKKHCAPSRETRRARTRWPS